MKRKHLTRKLVVLVVVMIVGLSGAIGEIYDRQDVGKITPELSRSLFDTSTAKQVLESLAVKGRSPKTGYSRQQFGSGWSKDGVCDMRNIILARDLQEVKVDEVCRVQSGMLDDPYTGEKLLFKRGPGTSAAIQIDHVVALSDAWQKGAQALTVDERLALANDPLNLLAVDGPANQQKGDSDAASWLPANKSFRCQYVARQVAVKKRYQLWVTAAEKVAIAAVLERC